MMNIPNFHDSILVDMKLDWAHGKVEIWFQMPFILDRPKPPLDIVEMTEISDVQCPRFLPWGPSIYVNEATLESNEQGNVFIVEMQSGDVIRIAGRAASLRQLPADVTVLPV